MTVPGASWPESTARSIPPDSLAPLGGEGKCPSGIASQLLSSPGDQTRETSSSRRRWAAVSSLVIGLVALVTLASWAASQQVDTNGAFALAARNGRVAFSIGDEVLLTDDEGRLLAVASDEARQPWRFSEVANLSFDGLGRLYVTDSELHALVRFDDQGRDGQRVPLAAPPALTFEFLAEGDLRVLADTMGHHLQSLREDGSVEQTRRVVYPNGVTLTELEGSPAVVFAETGRRTARAWSTKLEPLDWPAATKLNADLQRRSPRDLLEVTVTPQGELLAADCPDPAGECTIVRVDARGKRIDRVADVKAFIADEPEATEGLLGVGELAATMNGTVLVASPRLGAVLAFSSATGGTPSGGFCTACDAAELGPGIDVSTLAGPLTWKNGTIIRRFGDAAVEQRVNQLWAARRTYAQLERGARTGTWLIATALLVTLFLSRQARGEATQTKLERVFAELLRPQLRGIMVATSPIALAFVSGLALGTATLGLAAGAALGIALGALASRLLMPPLFIRLQGPDAGRRAIELFLPELVSEPVRWARFVRPRRSLFKELVASANASQIDELLDALEALAPRLTLLVSTERRLLSVPTSLLGAPQGPVLELDVVPSREDVGTLGVRAPGVATWRWWLGPGPTEDLDATGVTLLCERCGGRLGQCEHSEVELAVPLLASLVFPGLGALLKGDLGQARVTMLVALGFLLEVVRTALPQHLGTLPPNTELWLAPLGGYVMTALGAAFSMFVGWRRARFRINLASRKGPS